LDLIAARTAIESPKAARELLQCVCLHLGAARGGRLGGLRLDGSLLKHAVKLREVAGELVMDLSRKTVTRPAGRPASSTAAAQILTSVGASLCRRRRNTAFRAAVLTRSDRPGQRLRQWNVGFLPVEHAAQRARNRILVKPRFSIDQTTHFSFGLGE